MEKTPVQSIDPLGIYEKFRSSTPEKRVCFIFGAGASAGYSRIPSQPAPPVVAALFDDSNTVVNRVIRLAEHEAILRRRDDIREALVEYGGDLEAYLGRLYSLNENNDLFSRLILYMQDLCFVASQNIDGDRKSNNYLRLIYRMEVLKGANWSCVTFNYDTILEKTFVAAGSDGRSFIEAKEYQIDPKIINVHGSINFRFLLRESLPSQRTARDVLKLMMSYPGDSKGGATSVLGLGAQKLPGWHERAAPNGVPTHFYNFPFMMIPIHNTNLTHSDFFQTKVNDAISEVDKADLVVAVGYNFGDKIFLDGLRNLNLSNKEIILVSGSDFSANPNDCLGYTALSTFWTGQMFLFRGEKFTGFIDSIGPQRPE